VCMCVCVCVCVCLCVSQTNTETETERELRIPLFALLLRFLDGLCCFCVRTLIFTSVSTLASVCVCVCVCVAGIDDLASAVVIEGVDCCSEEGATGVSRVLLSANTLVEVRVSDCVCLNADVCVVVAMCVYMYGAVTA